MLAPDSTGAMKITSKHEQISSTPSREKSGKNNEPRDRRDKILRFSTGDPATSKHTVAPKYPSPLNRHTDGGLIPAYLR